MSQHTRHIELDSTVPAALAGRRLDQVLAELFPEHSRSRLQQWTRDGAITVDGRHCKPRDKVLGGERIEVRAVVAEIGAARPEAIGLEVVYEDDALLVVNKPVGMVVHPGAGNHDGTLQNAVLHHAPSTAHVPRAGIVHRLDKDTSGLMVVAKTLEAQTSLVAQLQVREVKRTYLALANGVFTGGGTVDEPIGRHPRDRVRMAVVSSGKPAVTHYRIEARFQAHTLLRVNLETGRTHQIRVHMAHLRHPLLGDRLYGARPVVPKAASESLLAAIRGFERQALHATELALRHPDTDAWVSWSAELPEDMARLLDLMHAECPA